MNLLIRFKPAITRSIHSTIASTRPSLKDTQHFVSYSFYNPFHITNTPVRNTQTFRRVNVSSHRTFSTNENSTKQQQGQHPNNSFQNDLSVVPKTLDDFFNPEYQRQTQSWWEQYRPRNIFMRPMKMEDDLPLLVDRGDGKTRPVVLLPKASHDYWKLWNVPDVVAIPRKQLGAVYFVYILVSVFGFTIAGLPPALDLLKDAEKKHKVLKKEVAAEQYQLFYLHQSMTPEEIYEAMDPLPHRPGLEWNPDLEDEMRLRAGRTIYPS